MQNNISKRLKILIGLLGLNLKDFSKKTGIPYPTLLDYLADKRTPGGDNLQKIAMQLHVNLNWLLTGEGEPFVKKPVEVSHIWRGVDDMGERLFYVKIDGREMQMPESDIEAMLGIPKGSLEDYIYKRKAEKPVEKAEVEDFVYVPVVSGRISAGGGLIPDTSIELRLAFRRDWIQRHGDPRNMSLIRVSGDSMEPTLYSGDIVLVDHNRNYIDPQGGIYAIAMDDIIMIKRLQMIYPAMKIRVISDNPRYETFELEPDRVVINGKVIWFGREIER